MEREGTQIRVITVSREFGAGGSELAAALSARLGWPVLDPDIVHRVAERMRCDDDAVERYDEHPPSLLARIATVLIIPQPEMYSFPPADDLPSHDRIAAATRAVIEEVAASPPIIVVGHGAQCIFAHRADALHVRVIAPVGDRLRRIVDRMGVDAVRAGTLLRRADQDRSAYVQRYFHQEWRNDLLYDLLINTGRVSIAEAAALVAELVDRRGAVTLPAATTTV